MRPGPYDQFQSLSPGHLTGFGFRMLRGVQPTIRQKSLIVGERLTGLPPSRKALRCLGRPRLHMQVEPQGTVRWTHASTPLFVAPSAVRNSDSLACGASQAACSARRSHIRAIGSGDALNVAPGFRCVKSWEPVGKNVIVAANAVAVPFVRSMFDLCSFHLPLRAKGA